MDKKNDLLERLDLCINQSDRIRGLLLELIDDDGRCNEAKVLPEKKLDRAISKADDLVESLSDIVGLCFKIVKYFGVE